MQYALDLSRAAFNGLGQGMDVGTVKISWWYISPSVGLSDGLTTAASAPVPDTSTGTGQASATITSVVATETRTRTTAVIDGETQTWGH